ncbi:hypothetical protein [Actinoplanes sp. NPDC051851]|uniref:hypothetical protein n=1 Tax=Actinoplanes sp. NPDC051851 TaxID=3154753 RepID=UPI00343E13FF
MTLPLVKAAVPVVIAAGIGYWFWTRQDPGPTAVDKALSAAVAAGGPVGWRVSGEQPSLLPNPVAMSVGGDTAWTTVDATPVLRSDTGFTLFWASPVTLDACAKLGPWAATRVGADAAGVTADCQGVVTTKLGEGGSFTTQMKMDGKHARYLFFGFIGPAGDEESLFASLTYQEAAEEG